MPMTTNRMFDLKDCKMLVWFGNKSELYATKIGKFKGIAVCKSRKKTPILLNNVKFVTGLYCILLGLSKAMNFFELSGKYDQLKLNLKNWSLLQPQDQEWIRISFWLKGDNWEGRYICTI